MNILFFLKPKINVTYLYEDSTLDQALSKLDRLSDTAFPVISPGGKYLGTLTEDCLLQAIRKQYETCGRADLKVSIKPLIEKNEPVSIDTNMDDIVSDAMEKGFVPVVDDRHAFIGVITREEVIRYCKNSHTQTKGVNYIPKPVYSNA